MAPGKGRRAAGQLTPKGEQSRQRIVAAAARLMFDGGVSGTTIEGVRAAAGVSSSQVYHYFKDKKALVEAVIEYQTETIVGGQEPMLAALDSLEGLRAWRGVPGEDHGEGAKAGGGPLRYEGGAGAPSGTPDPAAGGARRARAG